MGGAEPLLHQWAGRRQDEVGQADGRDQQEKNVPRGLAGDLSFPTVGRRDRQEHQRQEQERQMKHGLIARLEVGRREMGVSVAAEQQRLEKKQTGRPYARAAAKPREDEFPDQRLNLEQ